MYGKIGKIENQRQHGDENEPLQEAIFRTLLGKITNPSDEAKTQRQYQNDKSDKDGKKIKRVAGARVGHGFFVTVVGKRVAIYFVSTGSVRRISGRLDLLRRGCANSGSFLRQDLVRRCKRNENRRK